MPEPLPEKILCLTIGDPTGIGPEITAKFLSTLNLGDLSVSLCIVGDIQNLDETAQRLNLAFPPVSERITYREIQDSKNKKTAGQIAYQALEESVAMIGCGQASGMVTGPISKENLHRAGVFFNGHTEILAQLAQQYFPSLLSAQPVQPDMLFAYRGFRVLLLTRHVPLRDVSEHLDVQTVFTSLKNLVTYLRESEGIGAPRLCMLAVNPHGGEIGGDEEMSVLIPAIEKLRRETGIAIETPKAADAVFRAFDANRPEYDAYISPYHDQGLIPMKMVAGLAAVNITLGLPFIRTSVSHGTAPDIAGLGVADPASLFEAFDYARRLLNQRGKYQAMNL